MYSVLFEKSPDINVRNYLVELAPGKSLADLLAVGFVMVRIVDRQRTEPIKAVVRGGDTSVQAAENLGLLSLCERVSGFTISL